MPEKAEAPTHDVYGVAGQDYVTGEVLVKFGRNTNRTERAEVIEKTDLKKAKKLSTPNLYLLKITDGATVQEIIEQLEQSEVVKYAEPNYIRRGYKK